MIQQSVGAIVVAESEGLASKPVGILTDRDVVVGQLRRGADLFCLSVEDVMTKAPLTFTQDCDVAEASERMGARRVRRAPVVDRSGNLVGLVSIDDLLPAVADSLGAFARLLGAHAHARKAGRAPEGSRSRAAAPAAKMTL